MDGAAGGIWDIVHSVKMVSVCVSFESDITKVLLAIKWCGILENIAIFDLIE
jgi:hypothetical protein